MRVLTFLAAVLVAGAAHAQAINLTPADPQPDEAALSPGLAVQYAYPADVKSLTDAKGWLDYGTETGPPLIGFDYPDTLEGEKALTSRQSIQVVAAIEGYIKFDAPGVTQLDFISNDGLLVKISGQEVSRYDGRHPCESGGTVDVNVPAAGWYELEALYFQRAGTACLLMMWGDPGADLGWTPNEAFAHKK